MRKTLTIFGRGLMLIGLTLATLPLVAEVAAAAITNPDLPADCGLDLGLVLDRSNSIGSNDDEVTDAAQAFVDALAGTGGLVKVTTFGTTADGLNAAGNRTSTIADVVYLDPATLDFPDGYGSSGGTNWDDGIEVLRRSPGATPDLVIMITDGEPTYRNEGATGNGIAENGHGTGTDGNGSSTNEANDLGEAIDEADALKAAGAHTFIVGVGGVTESYIQSVSGPDRLEGADGVLGSGGDDTAFGAADYSLVDDFDELGERMRALVTELCSPSLNIRKLLIPVGGVAAPEADWDFDVTVEDYEPSVWSSPAVASGTQTVSVSTEADGFTNLKWEPPLNDPAASTDIVIEETLPVDQTLSSVECTRNTFDGQDPQPLSPDVSRVGQTVTIRLDGADDLGAEEGINCVVTNRAITPSTITIDKNTIPAGLPNGFDFDLAPAGEAVVDSIDGLSHADPAEAFDPVLPGTYSVTEDVPDAFTLTAATCDDTTTGAVETESPEQLEVGEGESWLCTFTNTADPGSITVVKNASGADGTFAFTGDLGGFDIATTAGTGSETFSGLTPGVYGIAETDPAPWVLASASCDDQSPVNAISVQPGEHVICTFTNRAPNPTIVVTKSAQSGSVAEPGGPVTFDVTVTNTSVEDLTLTSLIDNVDGGPDLDVTDTNHVSSTTCSVPVALPLGGPAYSCSFTLPIIGNAGDVVNDVLTGTAVDADQNEATDTDDASVTVTDVDPQMVITKSAAPLVIPENGAQVIYTVGIQNTGVDPLTITSMTDSVEGDAPFDITSVGGDIVATTCPPGPIAAGGSASCSFTATVDVSLADLDDGDVDDTVSVTAQDDEGNPITRTADADVTVTDLLPAISVTKEALTPSVTEAGGSLTYSVLIQNTSSEWVTIDSITDSVEGGAPVDLTNTSAMVSATTCSLVGTTLAPGGSTTCSFTVGQGPIDLASLGDGDIDDVVTVTGSDDEGNPASDTGVASVEVTDVRPSIDVDKTADPTEIPETGGPVTYTVEITNTSEEAVTIVSVTDAVEIVDADATVVDSDPSTDVGTCAALVGTSLDPDETVSCEFTLVHDDLDAGWVIGDVVTVEAVDNDSDEPVTADDDAEVAVTDVAPTVTIDKDADVDSIDAPGGDVTYTVTVVNTSAEPVTIVDLTDDPAFPTGGCTPDLIGVVLQVGDGSPGGDDTASCTFTAPTGTVSSGDEVIDTVTVVVVDNDGTEATADDSETVGVTDGEVIASGEEPEVLPDVITRPQPSALAFTGMQTRTIVILGAASLLLGVSIVLVSRAPASGSYRPRHLR